MYQHFLRDLIPNSTWLFYTQQKKNSKTKRFFNEKEINLFYKKF